MNTPRITSAAQAYSPRQTLTTDCRGAILVLGIVMGTLLVGALWNIVSIGDAILWRERMQDAADAAAFENAVWNARGMNVIVFLNLVMSAAMAFLVLVRGIVILLGAIATALKAATFACLAPITPITIFLCSLAPYAQPVESARQAVSNFEQKVANPAVERILKGTQTAQAAVATLTPLLGVLQSAAQTSGNYDVPSVGISSSLLPTGISTGSMPRIGKGVSLPVSQDTEAKLCEKAGRFIPHELSAMLQHYFDASWLAAGGDFLKALAGAVTGALPSVFCGNAPLDITQLTDMYKKVAQQNCEDARKAGTTKGTSAAGAKVTPTAENLKKLKEYEDYWKEGFISGPSGTESGYVFDTTVCEQKQFDKIQKEGVPTAVTKAAKPARVWQYAKNGDFFMQSWGLSSLETGRVTANDMGISFPAVDTAAKHPANPNDLGTAQAEMYWDTGDGSGCDGSWTSCGAESMWLMRWKARLRRLHNPIEMAARSATTIAVAELASHIGKAAKKVFAKLEGAAAKKGADHWYGVITRFMQGKTWDLIGKLRNAKPGTDPINNGAKATVGERLAQNPPPPDQLIIH